MCFVPDVLGTTRFVVDNARDVTIDPARVEGVAAELAARPVGASVFDCARHPCGADPGVASFVLVMDTLNFSFWPDPGQPRWTVTVEQETLNGYWALVGALRRALANGVPLTEASFLETMTAETLAGVLAGDGPIPLLSNRVAALREVGRGLIERDRGQFVNMIHRAGGSATKLVGLLVSEFTSFADVATYRGQPVHFLKRAQICAADLFGASRGEGFGRLTDLDRLTAFADYKVPQVLRRLGALVYSHRLAATVDGMISLPAGSEAEVEIRAGTIWAVEEIRRALATRGVDLRAFEIDWHLWELGQHLPPDARPYHRTRTVYY